jgi:hypothetical protein
MKKRTQKRAAVAAFVVVIGIALGMCRVGPPKQHAWQWVREADASSVILKLAGDTLSLISGAAHDTTIKSSYDCCQVFATSMIDTTRPVLVLGATRVLGKVMASDTAEAFVVRLSDVQVSDDSTNWWSAASAAVGDEESNWDVSIDTTAVGFAAGVGAFRASASGGGGRFFAISPIVEADAAEIPSNPLRIQHKFMRFIFQKTVNAVIPSYRQNAFRVRVYVERDDLGEAWLAEPQGR